MEYNTFWVTWQRKRCVVLTHQMSVRIIAWSLKGSMMQMGKFKPGDHVMVWIKDSRYCPLFFTTPQSIAFINTTLVRCICVIVAKAGFLVLKLQRDFKKYPVNVLIFFGRIWKPRNNLSFPTAQREHLLTNKSFKGMVQKLSSNMEILCRLLVH